ncbi:MAG: hypothetical protein M3Q48_00115 [Actinomycetota bacterium]|jgi:hypothetical protein|nr:hypothetical protein [Actinomycetota bacterium]
MLRRRHGVVGARGLAPDRKKADNGPTRSTQPLSPDDIARIVRRSTFHTGFAPRRHYKR